MTIIYCDTEVVSDVLTEGKRSCLLQKVHPTKQARTHQKTSKTSAGHATPSKKEAIIHRRQQTSKCSRRSRSLKTAKPAKRRNKLPDDVPTFSRVVSINGRCRSCDASLLTLTKMSPQQRTLTPPQLSNWLSLTMDARNVPSMVSPPSVNRTTSQERRPRTQMIRLPETVKTKWREPAFRHHKDASRYISEYRNKYTTPRTREANPQKGGATTRQSFHWPAIKILLERGWRHSSVKTRCPENDNVPEALIDETSAGEMPKLTQSASCSSLQQEQQEEKEEEQQQQHQQQQQQQQQQCHSSRSSAKPTQVSGKPIPLPWVCSLKNTTTAQSPPPSLPSVSDVDCKSDTSLSATRRFDERIATKPLRSVCDANGNERLPSACNVNNHTTLPSVRNVKSKPIPLPTVHNTTNNDTPLPVVENVHDTLKAAPSVSNNYNVPAFSVSVCNINDTPLPLLTHINSFRSTNLRSVCNVKNDTPLLSMCHNNADAHSAVYNHIPILPSVCNINDKSLHSEGKINSASMTSVCNINSFLMKKPSIAANARRRSSLGHRPPSQALSRPTRLPSNVINGVLTQKPRSSKLTPSTPRKSHQLPCEQTMSADTTSGNAVKQQVQKHRSDSVTEAIRRLKHNQWRVPQRLPSSTLADVLARRQRRPSTIHCGNTGSSVHYRARAAFWTVL